MVRVIPAEELELAKAAFDPASIAQPRHCLVCGLGFATNFQLAKHYRESPDCGRRSRALASKRLRLAQSRQIGRRLGIGREGRRMRAASSHRGQRHNEHRRRYTKYTPLQWREAWELRQTGLFYREISEKMGLPHQATAKRLCMRWARDGARLNGEDPKPTRELTTHPVGLPQRAPEPVRIPQPNPQPERGVRTLNFCPYCGENLPHPK